MTRSPSLHGRKVGLLVDDGSDADTVGALYAAVADAGGAIGIIARRVGLVHLDDGRQLVARYRLADTPPTLFDAVALVLSGAAGYGFVKEWVAVEWVRAACAHSTAIAFDNGARAVLRFACVHADVGMLDPASAVDFIRTVWSRPAA